MVDEYKRVGLPAPEFNTDGNFVWVVFKYNRDSVVSTQQATQQVTKFIKELISVVNTNEYSVKEIMSLLKLKNRVNFLRTYLTPAQEEGLIAMKYLNNPKHPGQKYRLTEKGKALLK